MFLLRPRSWNWLNKMKIYLIGLSGSGKTTLGRKLSRELMCPFVDLDEEIEKKEGTTVREIFATKGEDYFRQVESRALIEWSGSEDSFVMGTGGGTPCFYNGIEIINQTGLSIFLDTPVSELIKRLEKKTDRPLLHSADTLGMENKLTTLRTSRLHCYQQAKITVQNADIGKLLTAVRLKT